MSRTEGKLINDNLYTGKFANSNSNQLRKTKLIAISNESANLLILIVILISSN